MKFFIFLFLFLFLNNCSLNKDSNYWTQDIKKNKTDQKKLNVMQKKSVDITTMSKKDYEIYIDDYTKKSNYPDISQ